MGYSLDTPLTTTHKSSLVANLIGSPSHPTQGNSMFCVTEGWANDHSDSKVIKHQSHTRVKAQSRCLDMEGSKISPSNFKVLVNLRHKLFIALNKDIPLSTSSLLAWAINMAAINSGAEEPIKWIISHKPSLLHPILRAVTKTHCRKLFQTYHDELWRHWRTTCTCRSF